MIFEDVYDELELWQKVQRVLKGEYVKGSIRLMKIEEVSMNETLLLHVGAAITMAKVTSKRKENVYVKLTRPVCAQPGSRVALSRKIAGRWRLIGYGMMR